MDGAPPAADLLYDFGGDGPPVHLAHANAYPPATYRPLAAHLTPHCHLIGLAARPLWPGSPPESAPDWHTLAGDLIRGLDELGLRGIVGVGHSMGGVCTLWAAIRRPDLFRAVVLIDPVILSPVRSAVLRLARGMGLYLRPGLIQGALRRRRVWPSRQACYEQYRGKPVFARWPDDSLWAYVEAGTRPRADGQVELVYLPEWEAHVYATVPTDVWRDVHRLRIPALFVRGEHSETFRPLSQAVLLRRVREAHAAVVPGSGHMVPMERPAEVAALVEVFL